MTENEKAMKIGRLVLHLIELRADIAEARAAAARTRAALHRAGAEAEQLGRDVDEQHREWPTPDELYQRAAAEREVVGEAAQVLLELNSLGVEEELFRLGGGVTTLPLRRWRGRLDDDAWIRADREPELHAGPIRCHRLPLALRALAHRVIAVAGTPRAPDYGWVIVQYVTRWENRQESRAISALDHKFDAVHGPWPNRQAGSEDGRPVRDLVVRLCEAEERREGEEGPGRCGRLLDVDGARRGLEAGHLVARGPSGRRERLHSPGGPSRSAGGPRAAHDGRPERLPPTRSGTRSVRTWTTAQLIKLYGHEPANEARYSPPVCLGAIPRPVQGDPDPKHISTSYVERQNLNIRMGIRRFTRLTNAFGKKLESETYPFALYLTYSNFCRIHKTVRMSPAMAAGITSTLRDVDWIVELIEARTPPPQKPGPKPAAPPASRR